MSNKVIQSEDKHRQKDRLYHNAIASEYDEVIVKPRQFTNDILFRNYRQYFKKRTAPKGLDLGCGTGHMTLRFSKYFQSIDAVDNSEAMLAQAEENLAHLKVNINFIRNDYVKFLPEVEKENYDAIFCTGFLHHLRSTELQWLLKELYRVLREDGLILISEPIKIDQDEPAEISKWNARARLTMRTYSPEICEIGNEHLDTDEEPLDKEWFTDLLCNNGFHIKKQIQSWEIYPIASSYLRNYFHIRRMFNKYSGTGNVFTVLVQK
ncbi:MAG: class I SAM-dependent methyltransferase [Thermoleophilia bacterium]